MPRPSSTTLKEDGVGGGFSVDADGRGDRGELDGVREEIGDDLQDAVGVAVEEERLGISDVGDGGGFEREVHGVRVGHGGHGVDGLLSEFAKGAAANLQRGAAGLHAFEIKDVVDEADEAVGVGDGDAEKVERFGVNVADDAGGEKTEGSADAGKGGAEFVGDGGDELVFEGVKLGAVIELQGVLVVLFASLSELLREFADAALGS